MEIREWFERNLPMLTYKGRPIDQVLTPQMREDFYHFEGNAQALRLVSKLHFLVDERGMNLTYALLNTIIKYPVASTQIDPKSGNIKDKKIGYYYADREIFQEIQEETGTDGCRHPLTFILEAADDIAYKTADIEDAFVKGFISYHTLLESLRSSRRNTRPRREDPSSRRTSWRSCICGAESGMWKIRRNTPSRTGSCGCRDSLSTALPLDLLPITMHHERGIPVRPFPPDLRGEADGSAGGSGVPQGIYLRRIYRMEVAESAMIDFLMDKFIRAVIRYDVPGEKLGTIENRMVSFISSNYKNAYHYHAQGKSEEEKLYLRLLLVTDYICGMTDSYAKRLYQEIKAIV